MMQTHTGGYGRGSFLFTPSLCLKKKLRVALRIMYAYNMPTPRRNRRTYKESSSLDPAVPSEEM